MAMKIVSKPIVWPVHYVRPGDLGEAETYDFNARFRRPANADEWAALTKPRPDDPTPIREVLAKYLVGFDEVEIDGSARGTTPEDALALCTELVGLENAAFTALMGSLWGIRLGNFPPPPATGPAAETKSTTEDSPTSSASASPKIAPAPGLPSASETTSNSSPSASPSTTSSPTSDQAGASSSAPSEG